MAEKQPFSELELPNDIADARLLDVDAMKLAGQCFRKIRGQGLMDY